MQMQRPSLSRGFLRSAPVIEQKSYGGGRKFTREREQPAARPKLRRWKLRRERNDEECSGRRVKKPEEPNSRGWKRNETRDNCAIRAINIYNVSIGRR